MMINDMFRLDSEDCITIDYANVIAIIINGKFDKSALELMQRAIKLADR